MLVVYTFVFSVVFKARWGTGGEESQTNFAMVLFVGMIVYGLFAEMVNRAPGLILPNINYVKKVIFPLEILPVVGLGAALLHAFISLGVLLAAFLLINGSVVWTVILVPLIIPPPFYPISSLPEKFQIWLMLNPLTFVIEQSRAVMIFGKLPDWSGLGIYSVASLAGSMGRLLVVPKNQKRICGCPLTSKRLPLHTRERGSGDRDGG